ncbi:MAG: hypothetical protein ACSLEW_01300 [Nocardioides sp.]
MPSGFNAFDQFCGYLVLDALVANRDRHEENWGVLRDPAGRVTLAPSYDHGNSLGFNLQDDRRLLELNRDPQLERWASRGMADRFEASRNVTLVAFAHRALTLATLGVDAFWLDQLAAVTGPELETVITGTPEMSDACRTFCLRLLATNQRRLLDGI